MIYTLYQCEYVFFFPDNETAKSSFDVITVLVEDLICAPGRAIRPNKFVFIMRGLPGSGKTYVTKLIKVCLRLFVPVNFYAKQRIFEIFFLLMF